ncbi:DoxX family protein [Streptomyces thermoviolaceus]|uniref:DoxX family protein n=1 Tax=Streptomyces thermoviolaceus TaxID=1952 RepID=UPI0033A798FD
MIVKRSILRPPVSAEPAAHPAATAGSSAAAWGLVLIRLTFGLLMAGHGAQKVLGWFGGGGPAATGRGFEALGYRPGEVFAVIAGLSEMLGGLGLALGFLTPLAAAALIGVMINAVVTVTGPRGLWVMDGGAEYNVGIAVVALAIAAVGPGRLAVDRFFRWRDGGWTAAAVALALGGAGAALSLGL